jgi:hypothetical protein
MQGVGDAKSCEPLKESFCFQQPLRVVQVSTNNTQAASLGSEAKLASISGDAMIRVARTQRGSGGVAVNLNIAQINPAPFSSGGSL